ncbi:hypothetical protein H4R23_003166 [Coemansia sp. Cherry 401B]|nr:hypothetical protein IWW54_000567 [Coemansia sp. RSA 2705]KAJ2317132.1 hypothetical protein IWW52_003289 [Coemansia sp. RSA 2704]KAJ2731051.1 hypothetical protein H4R23_003166 [Coemansia sp. Cherry 401B]
MAGEKRALEQTQPADDQQSAASSTGTAHTMFLSLRLEPFISTSLIEILDVLAPPGTLSVPSTPPPRYEPPPPSYTSDTRSARSVPALDLPPASWSSDDGDAASVLSADSCALGDSVLDLRDSASGRSSVGSFGRVGGALAPRLQNELVLSVIMYEFLARRPQLSRSPSRDTVMTSN